MKSDDSHIPYETNEIGTPKDYTNDLYRVYFEVGEYEDTAKKLIETFLGEEKAKKILVLSHGYEFEIAIQSVPDIVKVLVDNGIGVYQVIRYAKLEGEWA